MPSDPFPQWTPQTNRIFPAPAPELSWLFFQNTIRVQRQDETIELKPLPPREISPADLNVAVSQANLISGQLGNSSIGNSTQAPSGNQLSLAGLGGSSRSASPAGSSPTSWGGPLSGLAGISSGSPESTAQNNQVSDPQTAAYLGISGLPR